MANIDLDVVRRSISATLAEIEKGHKALGIGPDPEDREAYDIICRIERKLLAALAKKKSSAA